MLGRMPVRKVPYSRDGHRQVVFDTPAMRALMAETGYRPDNDDEDDTATVDISPGDNDDDMMPGDDDETVDGPELADLTMIDLRDLAAAENVDTTGIRTKDDLINAIITERATHE